MDPNQDPDREIEAALRRFAARGMTREQLANVCEFLATRPPEWIETKYPAGLTDDERLEIIAWALALRGRR